MPPTITETSHCVYCLGNCHLPLTCLVSLFLFFYLFCNSVTPFAFSALGAYHAYIQLFRLTIVGSVVDKLHDTGQQCHAESPQHYAIPICRKLDMLIINSRFRVIIEYPCSVDFPFWRIVVIRPLRVITCSFRFFCHFGSLFLKRREPQWHARYLFMWSPRRIAPFLFGDQWCMTLDG